MTQLDYSFLPPKTSTNVQIKIIFGQQVDKNDELKFTWKLKLLKSQENEFADV